jgi:hypothetical protein
VTAKQRYWLIWEDDTPVWPEKPLTADEVGEAFRRRVEDDPIALVEVKMCTREDLDWAHVTDGIAEEELDDAAEAAESDEDGDT